MATQTFEKIKPKITDTGLSVLYDRENAIADIVFVHGLQGHPRTTWACEKSLESETQAVGGSEGSHHGLKRLFSPKRTSKSKNAKQKEPEEAFWPLDFLPEDCTEACILTWGYESKVSRFFGGAVNQDSISAHAKNLLHALKIRRLNFPRRRFIFVAHSLGGIIVKDALCRAARDSDPAVLEVYSSTHAILFLGTPHRGSAKADIAEIVRKLVSLPGFDTTNQHIRALQVNGAELERIHEDFMKHYEQNNRHFEVRTFQEAKGVIAISYFKLNQKIVEPFSSSLTGTEPTQTINADHMSMCRFINKNDQGYKQVLAEIRILISRIPRSGAPDTLDTNINASNIGTGSPSQATTASNSYSLNEVERKCVALLTQNTSDVTEYKSSLPSRVEGTCRWILSNSQYLEWNMQRESCLLWIVGYPGSGKTILSAYILEYLSTGEFSHSSRTTQCYFFCDDKIETQRDGTAILRSLIHQLLVRRRLLVKYVKAAYDIHGPSLDQNFNALWRIFTTIANDKRVGPISVIVDAIDECENSTRNRFLQDVLRLVTNPRLDQPNTPCIKFLVTSRPFLGRQYTKNLLQIDSLQDYIDQDLRLVIQAKVENIVQRTNCKPEVRAYLEHALYSKADRTFLWVTLVLHLLESSLLSTKKDFKRIIDELPKTLEATYERFLHEISVEYQTLATRLLHLLVGSVRPLTLDEIGVLIAIEDHHRTTADIEEDTQPNIQATIEGILGPLVRIWDSRVSLVHQSVKEFLENLSTQKENPLSEMYGVDHRNAHLLLAESCISYLLLRDFEGDLFSQDETGTSKSPTSPVDTSSDIESSGKFTDMFYLEEDDLYKDPTLFEVEVCSSIKSQYTLFEYSARYWAQHFRSGSILCRPELLESVLLLSDTNSPPGSNWFRFYWQYAETSMSFPQDFIPIVVISYFGHLISLKSFLRKGAAIEPGTGARAIYWASRMGHNDVVDLLLQESINPDTIMINGQSPLIAAVQFNRLDVVKLLLEGDGFISETEGYRVNTAVAGGRTALSFAAGNGFLEVVEQLLKHSKIEPNKADRDKWTPIFWSVGGNHLDVVRLLLADVRISVNYTDETHRNILSWAASAGHVEILKYLIGLKHLKARETDSNGRTALSWAAGNGHLESTVLLLSSGRIDVSKKDNNGRNAISWACAGSHDKVVEYLIGIDPKGADEKDVDGWTPLAWALFTRAPKTVEVLLSSGHVDVNKKDKAGCSALAFAASYGYLDVVRILLKANGIDVDITDEEGQTPLAYAARYPDIIKELQDFPR